MISSGRIQLYEMKTKHIFTVSLQYLYSTPMCILLYRYLPPATVVQGRAIIR